MPNPGIPPWQCCQPALGENPANGYLRLNSNELIGFENLGALKVAQRSVSAAANSTATDYIIGVDTTGAAVTVTLRTVDALDGRVIILSDTGGNATANNITLATEGAETIDGNATAAITADDGSLRVYCDGTNWFTY
jgi:hypothetical protein